ncbi:MAG: HAMP domain-containing sensor histidine kinase, partial [Patescibacteria group bacterium]
NVVGRCRELRVGLWQCPHFLFIVMGFIIASSVVLAHIVAERYVEPEVAVLIVVFVAVALFVVSHIIVGAFEKMAAAYHLKSEFIRIISHEMRTPLSSIKWQLNMLSESKGKTPLAEYRKAFSVVAEENEAMIRLVNNLLDIDRIENKAFPLSSKVFSLLALVQEITEEFARAPAAQERKILTLLPKEEVMVKGDEGQIKNVLHRLIDNAIRYSAISGEITVALEDFGHKAKLSVSDQGKGIPVEETENVFSKFFRGANLKYQTSGLGLGLYISRFVVEASGGTVGFNSIEGKGSTFFFTLPKADTHD